MISFSKIAYEAMAVIAYSADCPRLDAAYERLAQNLEHEGDLTIPALSQDELQRFEDYTAILDEGIAQTESMLDSRDPVERAPYEKHLSQMMKAFTDISPNAPYAEDLHQEAAGNSIYVHSLGENGAALRSPETQQALEEIERDYGLNAAALTARLELGAENSHLERIWIRDDLQTVAEHQGLDLSKEADLHDALYRTSEAYTYIRDDLIPERVLERVPHLEPVYEQDERAVSHQPHIDQDSLASISADIRNELMGVDRSEDFDTRYDRLQAMQEDGRLEEMARERIAREQAEYLRDKPDILASPDLVYRGQPSQEEIVDRALYARIEAEAARAVAADDSADVKTAVASDFKARYPDMPDHLARGLGQTYATALSIRDRQRGLGSAKTDPLEKYLARSQDNYSLTDTRAEMDELHNLIRDRTTFSEYEALRRGDLKGAERITTDPLLARQLVIAVEEHQRGEGYQFNGDAENRFMDHREYLDRAFESEHDRDHGYER
jgi:hypothetical protein